MENFFDGAAERRRIGHRNLGSRTAQPEALQDQDEIVLNADRASFLNNVKFGIHALSSFLLRVNKRHFGFTLLNWVNISDLFAA